MKKIFLALLLVIITIHCKSQTIMKDYDIKENTPEANSLMKYINNPVEYSRGLVDISVPLFEIKCDGITLPINLSYYSGGIKANEYSKWLGSGWTLNAAPTIVRSVRGKQDKRSNFKAQDFDYYALSSNNQYDHCYNTSIGLIDEEPDIFYYKLLNRSGSFMLKKEKQNDLFTAVTIPYDPIKIKVIDDETGIQKFEITDDNGVKYYFDVTERSEKLNYISLTIEEITKTAWKCSAIENEAGKKVYQFNYTAREPEGNAVISVGSQYEDNPLSVITSRNDIPNKTTFVAENMLLYWKPYTNSDGSIITGYYVDGWTGGNVRSNSRKFNLYPQKLSSIIFDNGSLVFNDSTITGINKTIKFSNTWIQGEIGRDTDIKEYYPMLDSIKIITGNKVESYKFQYNGLIKAKPLLKYSTSGIDIWGNQGSGYYYTIDVNHKLSKDIDYAAPDNQIYKERLIELPGEGTASNQGILQSIINPAGCKTEFTFESNSYIKDDWLPASPLPGDEPKPFPINAGGLRIKRINYSDPQTKTNITREFKYGKVRTVEDPGYGTIGEETGFGIIKRQIDLLCFMDIQKKFTYKTINKPDANSKTRLRTLYTSLKGTPNPVVYNSVTEFMTTTNNQGVITDNGKTIYKYNYPDYSWENDSYSGMSPNGNKYFLEEGDDYLYGQLLSKQIYKRNKDNTYKLISKTNYDYDSCFIGQKDKIKIGKVFQEYIFDINGESSIPNIYSYNMNGYNPLTYFNINLGDIYKYVNYSIYTSAKKISAETDSVFTDNGTIVSRKKYTYGNDKYIYPTKMEFTNSDQKVYTQSFKYPLDDPSSYLKLSPDHLLAMDTLKSHWNISPIIEETQTTGTSVISTYNNYKIFPNYKAPKVLKIITEFDTKGKQEKVVFNNYDKAGNPVYFTENGASQFVYLWGYSGQYLIAKILNSSFSEVEAQLGGTDPINNLSASIIPDMNLVDGLRAKLPNALITTYTYKPLVGISSITDPRNVKTFYDYDAAGQLKEIYIIESGMKKTLKSYDYHYRGQ